VANPAAWKGLRYPDSDLVGLVYRFALPGRHVRVAQPRAVDVACGPGRHVRLLNEVGYKALGIDSDAEMCRTATENGVDAILADVSSYRPAEPPSLAVCWGLTMLIRSLPDLIAAWQPEFIILDWRTPANSCLQWESNQRLDSGAVRLNRPGHVLHGQEYFFYDLPGCQIPGYERLHWQRVTRSTHEECNEWFQTVHRHMMPA
jgi:SAM-dependent methyltransferase